MMSEPWPLSISIGVFAVAALMTELGGVRLARSGDVLADRTRLGEAFFGAVFFGGMISLSGIVMTATAAFDDHSTYPTTANASASKERSTTATVVPIPRQWIWLLNNGIVRLPKRGLRRP